MELSEVKEASQRAELGGGTVIGKWDIDTEITERAQLLARSRAGPQA